MQKRMAWLLVLLAVAPLALLWGQYQMRHSQIYEREMQDPIDDPPDAEVKGEFAFARLRYRNFSGAVHGRGGGGGRRGFGGFGGGGRSWGIDSNRADRLFEKAIRRLTRIDSESVEEVIDVDDGPLLNYPWLYAVEVGHWELTDAQAKKLREYLDRGGFLMVDDFHGTEEWAVFTASLRKVFPDREVVELPNDDPIFHVVNDLGDRYQVPGAQFLRSGHTYEYDGYHDAWRGIYDDHGRVQVAICHNMDLGDAWQYADDPHYPEKYAALAIRIAVNYAVYPMTR
jgi:hypothetical protein